MPKYSNNIRIPWSRLLNVSTDTTSDQSSQNHNEDKYQNRQSSFESWRNAISELDLLYGGDQNIGINERSLNSQGDPDSNSLDHWSPQTATYCNDNNGGECDLKT